MERGNINKCYICGSQVQNDAEDTLYFDFFPKDNTEYNEDICKKCEVVVADVKEFVKTRIGK